jgi:hypothetical protein
VTKLEEAAIEAMRSSGAAATQGGAGRSRAGRRHEVASISEREYDLLRAQSSPLIDFDKCVESRDHVTATVDNSRLSADILE